MKSLPLTLTFLCLLPASLCAETTLYACTRNGQTTLESVQSKDCDTQKTYRYSTYEKKTPSASLRTEELRQLEASDPAPINIASRIRRYENVDERIGWSLLHGYQDNRVEKCHFYEAIYNNARAYIYAKHSQDIEIGPTDSAQLAVQLQYAADQMDNFCGP